MPMTTTLDTTVQPLEQHIANKILKEITKCSTIQCENVNRGHAATFLVTNVQNGALFLGHKPRDVVCIQQSPQYTMAKWLSGSGCRLEW